MKLDFERGPIYTAVKFYDTPYGIIAEYLGAIRSATSARPAGYQHMPSYRNKSWDGYIRLYKNNRFPSGLMLDVLQAVRALKHPMEIGIVNDRPADQYTDCYKPITPDMLHGVTLRDYQVDAARTLLQRAGGIAKMATNSGKTEVMAAICASYPGKVLVLTTKRELMYQTSERISQRIGEPVGYIGDSQRVSGCRVTVAMIQTLCKHDNLGQEFHDIGCVMFDECHHVPSNTAQKVMMSVPAWNRFGFSGTPLHNDNLEDMVLIGATGPVCVDITNTDLIEAGISAMPYVDMYVVTSDGEFKDDWGKSYAKYVVNNRQRNAVIERVVRREHAKATLILVDRLEHGRILQEAIPKSIFVHGSLSTEERRSVLDTLRRGEGAVVIATPIFDEGVDVPSVDLLVLAAGGETHIRLLQCIGRGMRRKDSNKLKVVDFVDDTNQYLLSHSQHRAELYEQEGFAVRVVDDE